MFKTRPVQSFHAVWDVIRKYFNVHVRIHISCSIHSILHPSVSPLFRGEISTLSSVFKLDFRGEFYSFPALLLPDTD
jgi:hypothetical protein